MTHDTTPLAVMRRVLTAYETHDLLGMEAHMQELRGVIQREEALSALTADSQAHGGYEVTPAGATFAERWRNVTGAIKDLL
jgi:hypothetical protein